MDNRSIVQRVAANPLANPNGTGNSLYEQYLQTPPFLSGQNNTAQSTGAPNTMGSGPSDDPVSNLLRLLASSPEALSSFLSMIPKFNTPTAATPGIVGSKTATPQNDTSLNFINSLIAKAGQGNINSYAGLAPVTPVSLSGYPVQALQGLENLVGQTTQGLQSGAQARNALMASLATDVAATPRVNQDIRTAVLNAYGNNAPLRQQANAATVNALTDRNQILADLANRFVASDGTISPQLLAAAEIPLRTAVTAAKNATDLADTAQGTIQDIIGQGIQARAAEIQGKQVLGQALNDADNALLQMFKIQQIPIEAVLQGTQFNNQVGQQQFQNEVTLRDQQAKENQIAQEAPFRQAEALLKLQSTQKQLQGSTLPSADVLKAFYTVDSSGYSGDLKKRAVEYNKQIMSHLNNETLTDQEKELLLQSEQSKFAQAISGQQATEVGTLEQRITTINNLLSQLNTAQDSLTKLKSGESTIVVVPADPRYPTAPQGTLTVTDNEIKDASGNTLKDPSDKNKNLTRARLISIVNQLRSDVLATKTPLETQFNDLSSSK